ncbi:hypothetical protein HNQ59_003932 [Chitinivorax tropicus]|uniref:Uncharacterized protein n=1 Tax=Chitinivorax tropicus TaxID=714531 RepID=A0A840MTP2_9PROT|nr:hypothetical protein [Chitinivorax tropicus]MBB5020607.1 hypothetical protein [Chitinivorax tropicus]
MTDAQYFEIAEQYLLSRNIGYLPPGRLGRKEDDRCEVIFHAPESLDPNVAVIDPPDVRVWVSATDGAVQLIYQM